VHINTQSLSKHSADSVCLRAPGCALFNHVLLAPLIERLRGSDDFLRTFAITTLKVNDVVNAIVLRKSSDPLMERLRGSDDFLRTIAFTTSLTFKVVTKLMKHLIRMTLFLLGLRGKLQIILSWNCTCHAATELKSNRTTSMRCDRNVEKRHS